jgi:hypothetical protein
MSILMFLLCLCLISYVCIYVVCYKPCYISSQLDLLQVPFLLIIKLLAMKFQILIDDLYLLTTFLYWLHVDMWIVHLFLIFVQHHRTKFLKHTFVGIGMVYWSRLQKYRKHLWKCIFYGMHIYIPVMIISNKTAGFYLW